MGVPPEVDRGIEYHEELALQERLWSQQAGGVELTVKPDYRLVCHKSEFSLPSYNLFPVSALNLRVLLLRGFISREWHLYAK